MTQTVDALRNLYRDVARQLGLIDEIFVVIDSVGRLATAQVTNPKSVDQTPLEGLMAFGCLESAETFRETVLSSTLLDGNPVKMRGASIALAGFLTSNAVEAGLGAVVFVNKDNTRIVNIVVSSPQ